MEVGVVPIGKKTIATIEYFAIQSGWHYIIAKKVIIGVDLVFTYFVGNKTDFTVAWANPNTATYADYNQSADLDILGIITSLSALVTAAVTLPSTARTPSVTNIGVSVGNIAGGAKSVIILTSEDFSGSILGVTANPNTAYSFAVNQNDDTLAAIAYVVSVGSIIVNKVI